MPGWPYSFVAALTPDHTSWTAVLDAVRPGPADDAALVTATQLRAVVELLMPAGRWNPGDADVLVVMDAGYDPMRLAHVLADLPVELVGRLRSDRILRLPKPDYVVLIVGPGARVFYRAPGRDGAGGGVRPGLAHGAPTTTGPRGSRPSGECRAGLPGARRPRPGRPSGLVGPPS